MTPKAVLLDLGNTLVGYFTRAESPQVRKECVLRAAEHLKETGMLKEAATEEAENSFALENYESKDFQVRPLEERLARCFHLPDGYVAGPRMTDLCSAFIGPVFGRAKLYEDSVPSLQDLRRMGMKLAIVSNLAWGSPARAWRQELARHGLSGLVDAFVTCRDIGWRKPARVIFEFTAERLGVSMEDCLFVGDDVRWDYDGARDAGMTPLLIDRTGGTDKERSTVHDLSAVLARVKGGVQ